MNNAITHYQTSFRVMDTSDGALGKLKRNVHGWIRTKENDRRFVNGAKDFFFRCDWPNLFRTHSTIVTNTYLSPTDEAWAMHYTEVDASLGRKRFWYSDIGLKKDASDVVVAIRIAYAWNAEDLSGDWEEPEPNVPKVVRFLLKGNKAYSGRPEFRLIEKPLWASPGLMDTLGAVR